MFAPSAAGQTTSGLAVLNVRLRAIFPEFNMAENRVRGQIAPRREIATIFRSATSLPALVGDGDACVAKNSKDRIFDG